MRLNTKLVERLEGLGVDQEKFESLVQSAMKTQMLSAIAARQVVLDQLMQNQSSTSESASDTGRTDLPDSEDIKADIKWVLNNWARDSVEAQDAPSSCAAGLLEICRADKVFFLKEFAKHLLPSKAQEEENARMSDTGRNVLRTIESLQRFRAKHVPQPAAGNPIEAPKAERSDHTAQPA